MRARRLLLLITLLVASAAMAALWTYKRAELTEALAQAPDWLRQGLMLLLQSPGPVSLVGLGLVVLVLFRVMRRSAAEAAAGPQAALRALRLSLRPLPATARAEDGPLPPLFGLPLLAARKVTLIAGPERAPAAPVVVRLLEAGAEVLVTGDGAVWESTLRALQERGTTRDSLDRLTWMPAPVDANAVSAWLGRSGFAGPPVVVVVGASSLGNWFLGERPESRLVRLIQGSDGALRSSGAAVLLLEPLPTDRTASPDLVARRLLTLVDQRWLFDGQRVHPLSMRRLGLAAWLVARGSPVSWGRSGERLEAALSILSAALLYSLMAAALVLGAARDGADGVTLVGSPYRDLAGSIWGNWWVFDRISAGEWAQVLHSDQVYWPTGVDLISFFGNVLAPFLSLPFQALGSYPGYWNSLVGVALIGNGLSGYLLARETGANRFGALIAGGLILGAPPLLDTVANGEQSLFWAFPLLLTLRWGLRALDGLRPVDGWLTGLFFGICCLGSWTYALMALAILVPAGLQRALGDPAARPARAAQLSRALRGLFPFLLAAGPLLARANSGDLLGLTWWKYPWDLIGDPVGQFSLSTLVQDSTSPSELLVGAAGDGLGRLIPLGAIGLLTVWMIHTRGRRWGYPALVLGSALLSLGPLLVDAATGLYRPLPASLLFAWLPLFSRLLHPERMLILTAIGLALMAGNLLSPLNTRLPASARLWASALCLAVTLFLPWASRSTPLPTWSYNMPEIYKLLTGEGTIAEIPIGYREISILYQPEHGHAMVNGPGEASQVQLPGDFLTTMGKNAVLRLLWRGGNQIDLNNLATLHDRGLRYIIVYDKVINTLVQSDYSRYGDLAMVFSGIEQVFGPPIYVDFSHRVYRVPRTLSEEVLLSVR